MDHGDEKARRATLKDVAAAAKVSINTASVVLNPRRNQAVVHPGTRARVEEAARTLGYRRNLAASRLAGGAANTFCILTDRMTNYFHSVIMDAFVSEASRHGFQCILGCTEPAEAHTLDYIRSLGVQGIDGFVIAPVWESPQIGALLPGLLHTGAATIFVDYRMPGHPGPLVACDHRAGARTLAQHLAMQGHRRAIYLRSRTHAQVWSIDERIAGTIEVLNGSGGTLEIVTADSMDADTAAATVWDRLNGATPPTALICANDHLAFSVIAGLGRRGLNVLGKLAVTGYDDVNGYLPDLLEFPRDLPFPWEMPLTTVHQPLPEIGARAAQELAHIARGARPAPGTDILLTPALVPRESTAHTV